MLSGHLSPHFPGPPFPAQKWVLVRAPLDVMVIEKIMGLQKGLQLGEQAAKRVTKMGTIYGSVRCKSFGKIQIKIYE
jgi:hypothetical protein